MPSPRQDTPLSAAVYNRRDARRLHRDTTDLFKRARKRLGEDVIVEVREALDALKAALGSDDVTVLTEAANRVEGVAEARLAFAQKSKVREYVDSIGLAVFVALLLRAFIFEAFQIPSASMEPTLLVGDHLFVSKNSFGVRIPFTTRYLLEWGEVRHGDILVFEYPLDEVKTQVHIGRLIRRLSQYHNVNGGFPARLQDVTDPSTGRPLGNDELVDGWEREIRYTAVDEGYELRSAGADGTFGTDDDLTDANGAFSDGDTSCLVPDSLRVARDYIKRVIGLPGDTIQLIDDELYINGERLDYAEAVSAGGGTHGLITDRRETIFGVEHTVRTVAGPQSTGTFVVRPGHFFVMGDNRDNSSDSRCWGQVPMSNIKGRAMFIFFSRDRNGSGGVRFERIFDWVR